jgi:hypothetical protein
LNDACASGSRVPLQLSQEQQDAEFVVPRVQLNTTYLAVNATGA